MPIRDGDNLLRQIKDTQAVRHTEVLAVDWCRLKFYNRTADTLADLTDTRPYGAVKVFNN